MNRAGTLPGGNSVVLVLLAVLLAYAAAMFAHVPQGWTEQSLGHAAHAVAVSEGAAHAAGLAVEHAADHASPPPAWSVIPFVLLLGAIAVFPLLHATEHWWEHNLNRFKVAAGLGLVTLAYYAFLHHAPVEAHWPGHAVVQPVDGVQVGFVKAILANAILHEYIPFIVLLFSLYVIAGGIRITGDLTADPLTNGLFMAVGGVLASFIGTTGAAMVLIRPLLETNRERKNVAHTVIFFIFIVCNCGGCLLPIGDPPLFLGYLKGVGFLWTMGLWQEWLFTNGMLLLTYCLLDHLWFHRRETLRDIERDLTQVRRLKIEGLAVNGALLTGVVLAVALLDPSKALPGTEWHPPMYLREVVQLALVAASLHFGSSRVREENNFNYAAIVEVAALFVGIFVCMQPALQILNANGAAIVEKFKLGPAEFFWATGALSSFLDNAPTYLVFFQTAQDPASAASSADTGQVPAAILSGISLGAVFMGAMTYIGNGPNFMVKAIAEKSGVKMPSFFGYMAYSCCILLPILALMNWLFLD
ncbi:MAG: sodium:proton antiporter [Pirellulales bacterium]|nr:sodium:proton antiporter [Pirellulales bacterium]